MTRLRTLILFPLLVLLSCLLPAKAAPDMDFAGKVVVIEIGEDSLMSKQGFGYISRIFDRASEQKARAVVFDLNTPGGFAWETSELMMQLLQSHDVPTYAYVRKAISAGALIAVSCDTIYMAPGSMIGAAGIVNGDGSEMDDMMRKKADSAFSAITRSVVEEKGHNPELVRSMMIPTNKKKQFGDVLLPKGELLSLTANQAVSVDTDGKPLLAKGIAPSIDDMLKAESIDAAVVVAQPTVFEQIAFWIAFASPLLILLGIGGIYMEFKTPGFGIGGIVAIIAFGLFFFGNNIAGNLAGYEMAALFVLGLILIIVEVFVIPGTLIAGIVGVIFMLVALFGGMLSGFELDYIITTNDWSFDSLFGLAVWPLFRLSLGLLGAAILIMVLMRYLPETGVFRRFANAVISGGEDDGEAVATAGPLAAGAYGIALTELKPNGKALFNGETFEVFSRDGILPKGTPLRVLEKRSFDFVVEQAPHRDTEPERSSAADDDGRDAE